jgi:dTDP-4-dehydrorhamnose reductase
VAGASGLLGANFVLAALARGLPTAIVIHRCPCSFPGATAVAVDLTQVGAAERLCQSLRPQWVVNCAALTNVDWCEAHAEQAWQVNVEMPRRLAGAARSVGARFVYVSTDAIFDGKVGDYTECDSPAPVNIYARTKWEGENASLEAAPATLVVRTNLFGWNLQDKVSVAEWMVNRLRAGIPVPAFEDVIFSPLLANDLSEVILDLITADAQGIFHVGATDACTKWEFARLLADTFELEESGIQRTSVASAPLRAPRPLNTSLKTEKVSATLGQEMPTVATEVRRFRELEKAGFAAQLKQFARRDSYGTH